MARENPGWGYTRIRDAMNGLGHEIGRTTVKRILLDHGIEPAPERRKKTPWRTFLKAHWEALAAADFFTVEVLTLGGLVRYSVFFLIELKTRRVYVAGITSQPCEAWMRQVARNLTDAIDGFLLGTRYLILDRDPLYSNAFRSMLKDAGINVVRLPSRSPDLNAYAERFVLSVRSECLNRLVPLGEAHLRAVIHEFVAHYHRERHHQGLGGRLVAPVHQDASRTGPVACRERLGGILKHYHWTAA